MSEVFHSFYKTVEGGEGDRCKYPTRLDVYGCGCNHQCSYCVDPDTMILMSDSSQKPIKDIQIGDKIVGVISENRYTRYKEATVTDKWETHKIAYRITLSDDREIICSGDHRWLTNRGWKYTLRQNFSNLTIDDEYLIGYFTDDSKENDELSCKNLKIKSIECIGERDLIDITTTTENFVANGCISHNCYARSLLDFRGNWHPNNPSVADKEEVVKVLDTIPKGTILRIGGMTDMFQPCEDEYHMSRWLIQELNARGIGYLIVTKGANILEKNIDVLDKNLAHIQISYTYSEGLAPKGFENASPPKDRIRVAERLQEEGFDVALRLSPFIPQFIDLKQVTECKVDKILVEFLRANAMIKKKMPYYDFTAWNQKQDGYQQLSLSAKKMLLKPIIATGKQVSVCEDYRPHWKWFRENVNFDKDDCCGLRKSDISE